MEGTPTTKGHILCVEDDADSRDLIVCILQRAGSQVTVTATSSEGLSLARRER